MPEFYCEIELACMTKQRPRFSRSGRTYMNRKYTDWKADLGWRVLSCKPKLIEAGDVHLYMEIRVRLKGRGDDDNYEGAVLDSLEGICYKNDRQVRKHALHPDGRIVRRSTGEDKIILRYKY